MEEENNRIVETLLGLSGASDEHMEEVLSAIPLFTERNMLSEWDGLPVKSRLPPEVEAGFNIRKMMRGQFVCTPHRVPSAPLITTVCPTSKKYSRRRRNRFV